jgi:hypothetical protein
MPEVFKNEAFNDYVGYAYRGLPSGSGFQCQSMVDKLSYHD